MNKILNNKQILVIALVLVIIAAGVLNLHTVKAFHRGDGEERLERLCM